MFGFGGDNGDDADFLLRRRRWWRFCGESYRPGFRRLLLIGRDGEGGDGSYGGGGGGGGFLLYPFFL